MINGDTNVLDMLLKYGYHSSCVSKLGKTPLHLSCQLGRKEMTEHLLNAESFDSISKYDIVIIFYSLGSE